MKADRESIGRCMATDTLHLILMPTEACNFRCTYCYEEFEQGQMLPSVVRGVKRLLEIRIPELRSLHLGWFGGEPLLAMDIVCDVMRTVASAARQNSHLQLQAHMTTNAYLLTQARFRELLEVGVNRFQVSFDGPRAIHDKKRLQASGKATFDRIWANLLALRDTTESFFVLVRLHVDQVNHTYLPEFLEKYARTFVGDDRFQLLFRQLACLGGPNDDQLPVLEGREGRLVIRSLRSHAETLGINNVTPDDFEPICHASKLNSFLIRSDGGVGKCTVALAHPNNRVGHIDECGRMALDEEPLREWTRGIWQGDEAVLKCPMRGYADVSTGHSLERAILPSDSGQVRWRVQ